MYRYEIRNQFYSKLKTEGVRYRINFTDKSVEFRHWLHMPSVSKIFVFVVIVMGTESIVTYHCQLGYAQHMQSVFGCLAAKN